MRITRRLAVWLNFCSALAFPILRALPVTDASSVDQERSVEQERMRGNKLFTGALPLRGRIATHATDMPPEVIRCANCHAYNDGPDLARSTAPRLSRAYLLLPIARHGGPDSKYDPTAFCTLLRRGVDPANIVITTEMPRYSLDDTDCAALWRLLTVERP